MMAVRRFVDVNVIVVSKPGPGEDVGPMIEHLVGSIPTLAPTLALS